MKHPNPDHPFNHIGRNATHKAKWHLLTFEEALDYVKPIGNYTIFKHQHSRMFIHVTEMGWLLHLLPYIAHSKRSYTEAADLHNRAMDRLQRKQRKEQTK
jgi:hypothetical protein